MENLEDKIISTHLNDKISLLLYQKIYSMEIIIKTFNKTDNDLDVKLINIDNYINLSCDIEYYTKMIHMINDILYSFNKSDNFENKVYHVNKLYQLIYPLA